MKSIVTVTYMNVLCLPRINAHESSAIFVLISSHDKASAFSAFRWHRQVGERLAELATRVTVIDLAGYFREPPTLRSRSAYLQATECRRAAYHGEVNECLAAADPQSVHQSQRKYNGFQPSMTKSSWSI